MNIKPFHYLLLCLAICTSQDISATPAQTKSVQELIKASDLEKVLNNSFEEMQPALDLEAERIILGILNKPAPLPHLMSRHKFFLWPVRFRVGQTLLNWYLSIVG